jgi:hypothetical protein
MKVTINKPFINYIKVVVEQGVTWKENYSL